jgi:hypothetical protein
MLFCNVHQTATSRDPQPLHLMSLTSSSTVPVSHTLPTSSTLDSLVQSAISSPSPPPHFANIGPNSDRKIWIFSIYISLPDCWMCRCGWPIDKGSLIKAVTGENNRTNLIIWHLKFHFPVPSQDAHTRRSKSKSRAELLRRILLRGPNDAYINLSSISRISCISIHNNKNQ